MSRRSLLAMTTSALLLLAPPGITWASSPNNAIPHPSATNSTFGFPAPTIGNNGYGVSTALSTALSVGGTANAVSPTSLPVGQGNIGFGSKKGPVIQLNSAPSVQTAIGAAVSIGGNASAAAIDTNDLAQINKH